MAEPIASEGGFSDVTEVLAPGRKSEADQGHC